MKKAYIYLFLMLCFEATLVSSYHCTVSLMKVAQKQFKDLVCVYAFDEGSLWQKIFVYIESENDKDYLMVIVPCLRQEQVKDAIHRQEMRNIIEAVRLYCVLDLLRVEKNLIIWLICTTSSLALFHKFEPCVRDCTMEVENDNENQGQDQPKEPQLRALCLNLAIWTNE